MLGATSASLHGSGPSMHTRIDRHAAMTSNQQNQSKQGREIADYHKQNIQVMKMLKVLSNTRFSIPIQCSISASSFFESIIANKIEFD